MFPQVEKKLADGLVEQAHFEKQLEKMATDPEIQAELRKIDREFISTESDGLEN